MTHSQPYLAFPSLVVTMFDKLVKTIISTLRPNDHLSVLALSALCRRPYVYLQPCRPYVVVDLLSIDLSHVHVLLPHQHSVTFAITSYQSVAYFSIVLKKPLMIILRSFLRQCLPHIASYLQFKFYQSVAPFSIVLQKPLMIIICSFLRQCMPHICLI